MFSVIMLGDSGAANIHHELVDTKHGRGMCANRCSFVDKACPCTGDPEAEYFYVVVALRAYTWCLEIILTRVYYR